MQMIKYFLIAEPGATLRISAHVPKDGAGAGDALVLVHYVSMRVDHPLFHCSSEKLPSCKDGSEAEGRRREKHK